MMGHINNLVVRFVRENLGDVGVARMFAVAGIEPRSYQSELIYAEEEFQALFGAAREVFGVSDHDAEVAFSKFFMTVSPQMFPAMFKVAKSARRLIEQVPNIHRNFPAAAGQGVYEDKVFITESVPERVVLEYDSPNGLCTTLLHVAEHVLEYYQEPGQVTEVACKKDGAPRCRFVVEFHAPVH